MTEYIYGTDGHQGHWLTGEEIVRCRDCAKAEHAEVHRFDGVRRYEWLCKRFPTFNHETRPDGFCAWACRKEPSDGANL